MKIALIALATAGALLSGAAAAGPASVATPRDGAFMQMQYRGEERIANAEQRAANINEREARLNARIQRGMRDGRITEWEARRLHRELRNIEAKERAYTANNGRIGWREFNELNRDLDQLAENVRREARDEQRY